MPSLLKKKGFSLVGLLFISFSFGLTAYLFYQNPIQEARAQGNTYYVATTGNDSNPGTLGSPFRTIQHCLDVVQPGETCLMRGGTYNESLVLKRSGSETARITIKNFSGESVSVNSGSSRTLTISGRLGYYTIEGLRFLTSGSGGQTDGNIDLKGGVWVGETAKEGGNDGFILRNCYVQGTIKLYGHHNLVENCEIDGMSKRWATGIFEQYGPSHDNTYRNNEIYGFSGRGIWSMSYTENIIVENNRVHDCSIMGVDLDGATHPVRYGRVRDNIIFNIIGGQGVGILLENGFDCVVERNLIYDVGHEGIQVFNYGQGCGHTADGEYRDDQTNTVLKNNVIYNVGGGAKGGINGYSIRGIYVYGNTIHNARGAGILLNEYCGWQCQDWVIKNNIFTDDDQTIKINGSASGLDTSNNLYYPASSVSNPGANYITADPQYVNEQSHDFHLRSGSPAINAGATIPDLTDDFDGNLRPQGGGYDIGAFEYGGTPGPSPTPSPTPTPTPRLSPSPTPTSGVLPGLFWEAEEGEITSPFTVTSGYVSQASTNYDDPSLGGRASYRFTLPFAGDYVIQAWVDAPDDSTNSFFVNIDEEPTSPSMIWDIYPWPTNGFVEKTVSWRGGGTTDNNEFVPKIFNLPAGEHTLIIRGREADTKLDKLSIALAILLSPGWNEVIWLDVSGVKASDVPDACPIAVSKENFWFKPYVKNYGGVDFGFESGKSYWLKCNQPTIWEL